MVGEPVEGITSIDRYNDDVCTAVITIYYQPCVVHDRVKACLDSVGSLGWVKVVFCIFYRNREQCVAHNAADHMAYNDGLISPGRGFRIRRVAVAKRRTVSYGRLPETRSPKRLMRADRPVTPARGVMGLVKRRCRRRGFMRSGPYAEWVRRDRMTPRTAAHSISGAAGSSCDGIGITKTGSAG